MYITFKDFSKCYSWPDVYVLKSLYWMSQSDDEFKPAFLKVKKKVMINPDKLFEIIEKYGKLKK